MIDVTAVGSLLAPAEIEELMAEAAQHVELDVCGNRHVTIVDAQVDRTTIITGDGNTTAGT